MKKEKIIESLKSLKTGHTSYSCRSERSGFCVCGADEDRWNLALDEAISYFENLK